MFAAGEQDLSGTEVDMMMGSTTPDDRFDYSVMDLLGGPFLGSLVANSPSVVEAFLRSNPPPLHPPPDVASTQFGAPDLRPHEHELHEDASMLLDAPRVQDNLTSSEAQRARAAADEIYDASDCGDLVVEGHAIPLPGPTSSSLLSLFCVYHLLATTVSHLVVDSCK